MCLKDLRDEFIYDCECRYGDCVFLTDSDIIKRALLLVSERQDSVAVGYAIGKGG